MIKTNTYKVPDSSYIHPSVKIECDIFELGENCYIGPDCVITCKEFRAGDYLYFSSQVEVGRGGCFGPNSIVSIGNNVGVFERTVLNPSEQITIGDNVGIGCEVLVWTHGAWLDVLEGFPADFGPVTIGDNVWLPARSIVLPHVNIGNNVVIGTNSIITKDIPDGALAAGMPAKVLKENCYPKHLTIDQKHKIVDSVVKEWYETLLKHKGIEHLVLNVSVHNDCKIEIKHSEGVAVIDAINRIIDGSVSDVVEDLRDFMRRKGIKIYTGKPFKSLKADYQKAIWNQ